MATKRQTININNTNNLISQEGCFDLQFRKDVKYNRPHSPTYYRWKAQFAIADSLEKADLLESIKKVLKCGKVHIGKNQARYSVQSIEEIKKTLIPYFRRCQLSEVKKKDFELWSKAVEIIYKNKRKFLSAWKKNDLQALLDIQKSIQQYKQKSKNAKWLNEATTMLGLLK